MRILAVVQGHYGQRMVDNIQQRGPDHWELETFRPPPALPIIVDDPEDFLPPALPQAELALTLIENPTTAQLIPAMTAAATAMPHTNMRKPAFRGKQSTEPMVVYIPSEAAHGSCLGSFMSPNFPGGAGPPKSGEAHRPIAWQVIGIGCAGLRATSCRRCGSTRTPGLRRFKSARGSLGIT